MIMDGETMEVAATMAVGGAVIMDGATPIKEGTATKEATTTVVIMGGGMNPKRTIMGGEIVGDSKKRKATTDGETLTTNQRKVTMDGATRVPAMIMDGGQSVVMAKALTTMVVDGEILHQAIADGEMDGDRL